LSSLERRPKLVLGLAQQALHWVAGSLLASKRTVLPASGGLLSAVMAAEFHDPYDFNFYPERHMNLLDGMLDIEVPQGWSLADLIRNLKDAECMLWKALNYVDDDGNIRARWR
jgi:hypothetical protein